MSAEAPPPNERVRRQDVNAGQDAYVAGRDLTVNTVSTPVARSAYLQQVRRIAPPDLVGREPELAELTEFCTAEVGPQWMWWQAPAWSGKSALMAWFVLNPPEGVRVVSFFITARWAGQSDRHAFVDVVLEQLTDVAGRPMPVFLTEATREAHLLAMLEDAAHRCADQRQRVVLVVDGLDEDRGVTTGPDAHSIAAMLPAVLPDGVRVVIAGRPNPPVPADVPDGHPLRGPGVVRRLAPSPYAHAIKADAQRELKELLHGTPAEQDLLGLVAAAGGGLSSADLAALTGWPEIEIDDHLSAVSGRTFSTRASRWQAETGPVVYVLAHEEIQNAAVAYLGEARLAGYRQRLHTWADGYRDQGWPAETPEYFLRGYYRLLNSIGDVQRMADLAMDQSRHDRMLEVTGNDLAAMYEIFTLNQRLSRQSHDPTLTLRMIDTVDRFLQRRDQISDWPTHTLQDLLELVSAMAASGDLKLTDSIFADADFQAQAWREMREVAAAAAAGDLNRARELLGRSTALLHFSPPSE
ncbi:hypothetical protein [Actinoallomurus sp. CA-150999]|uniref:hypothetical protein n=1 Tax=Actinoallomurus sp. CA-150999 TaxID=3239887 RepID=UPI003D93F86C